MQQQHQAWGHAQGYDSNYHKRPRRAPAVPSFQAGFQVGTYVRTDSLLFSHVRRHRHIHTYTHKQIHRDALLRHRVLCQLNKSFILVATHDNYLICFDQHAVDERIRLERLLRAVGAATSPAATAAACGPAAVPASVASSAAIIRVSIKPMVLKRFSPEQLALLATPACRAFLARFFFDYQLLEGHGALILRSLPKIVDALPDVMDFFPRLLADFDAIQQHQQQGVGRGGAGGGAGTTGNYDDDGTVSSLFLPSALRDTLNSRACRYAIMFHTELSRTRCKALLRELATTCAFPFQCAHGRPSCVPLCRLAAEDDGGDVVYEASDTQLKWRPLGGKSPPPTPLRFRRGLRKVHLRRFGKALQQHERAGSEG